MKEIQIILDKGKVGEQIEKLLDIAISQMLKCDTMKKAKQVWEIWNMFQANEKFFDAKEKTKEKIKWKNYQKIK